tara:strand:+ start:717 stop:2591 length:1875 start_codon:yes stop_codon:yes gene_type:complete
MISHLGSYSLIFCTIFAFLIILQSAKLIGNQSKIFPKKIYTIITLQLFFVIFSFSCLLIAFVSSDFSNITVYNNSHTEKPFFYKISGVWGNHEGSLLLWLLVLVLFLFLFILDTKNYDNKYKLLTVIFQEIIILGFLLFIIITSNPFDYIFPVPLEGLGLNPILQDPALAIHPPILYIGYVGTSLIFSSSLAAVINNTVNSEWAKQIKKWVFLSWIFLTLGIMLGSIWAYYELGWGGFWFWDPVENVSLMPWFCLTALLHTILVLEKRNALKNWTIVLSIATFSLSMSGTFLVRSGILNSIHTFANDPSRGVFILTFLFFLIFLAIIVLFIYSENDKKTSNNFNILSKETAVLVNNWFMMYFLSVVLIGTIYPIFLEVFTNEKISVGPPFYQKLMIPFLIPFFIFMSFGPRVKWINDKLKKINYTQIIVFISSLIIAYIIFTNSSVSYLFSSFLIAASIFLVLNSLRDFFSKSIQIPQKISHFSFSILILSILLNGIYSEEFNSNMKVGDELKFIDKTIKFKGINFDEKDNYKLLRGDFEVIDSGKNTLNFNPEIRIYNQPVISTSEADIKTNLFNDNFIVFTLLKDNEIFNVRYQHKPFMIWIWISIIMLAFGGTLAVIKYGK